MWQNTRPSICLKWFSFLNVHDAFLLNFNNRKSFTNNSNIKYWFLEVLPKLRDNGCLTATVWICAYILSFIAFVLHKEMSESRQADFWLKYLVSNGSVNIGLDSDSKVSLLRFLRLWKTTCTQYLLQFAFQKLHRDFFKLWNI